jgi:uncharacterized membrane protein YidH (DUF202 family)
MTHQDNHNNKEPTLLQVITSVLAAGFGVQSKKNRDRDFQQGNAATFVGVGLAAVVVFVVLLYAVVKWVLG